MDPVATRYIDRDGSSMAYQVIGDGPVDVVSCYEAFQHLDLSMTDPDINHNVERIAGYARSVYFQRRGFGLSDQVPYVPTMEQQADDVLAIMDAVGMRRATLVGWVTTCGAMALVAARSPDRVNSLILIHPMAQGPACSGNLHGWTEEERHDAIEGFRHVVANWGSGALVDLLGPKTDTAFNRRLMAVLERSSATPAVIQSHFEWALQQDIQDVLRAIQAPTRVYAFLTSQYQKPPCDTWRSSSRMARFT